MRVRPTRPQGHRLLWPLTPTQVEAIDEMFQILFRGFDVDLSGATITTFPTTGLTGTLLAAQFPALTGDVTTTAGSLVTTLATVNGNVGTFGSSTQTPIFTVNGKGLITAASQTTTAPPTAPHTHPWTDITATPTTLAGYGITDGGASVVRGEVPTGAINGSNTVYTTAAAYGTTLAVYRNGVRQKLTTDYTHTTTTTFTMVAAPLTGDIVQVDYSDLSGVGGGGGGASGALVLLETLTAAGSASLDCVVAFTSTYDEYLIEVVNLVPASNTIVQMLVSTNGGSSWSATGYDTGATYAFTSAHGAMTGTVNGAAWGWRDTNTTLSANGSYNATFRFYHPLGAKFKVLRGDIDMTDSGVGLLILRWFGQWTNTTAVNALRFIAASGNLTSGAIRIYGVGK